MRPHAALLRFSLPTLLLLALPLAAGAQIITRPLSGAQREAFERCMADAGRDETRIRACVRDIEQGKAPTVAPSEGAPAPTVTAPSVPVEEGAPAASPVVEGVPVEGRPVESRPVEGTPVEGVPAEATPVEATPVEATPVEAMPVEGVPAEDTPPADASTVDAPSTAVDPTTQPTDAERDFAELYGNGEPYDPVADPTLPAPVDVPGGYDPWERYNRQMHRFNNAIDRGVARPLARGYVKAVPRPVRLGVSNFFNNLGQPVSAVNALLQGKPKQAGQSLGRFLLNSTLGIGGIFDPASDARLPNRSEDFGQTLGVWGWKRSRYVELPLFGPRTVRDSFGLVGDAPLSPLRQVDSDRVRIPLQGLQLVDVRAQLLPTDALREGVEDDYALVRDAWMQRRDYQIFGDRMDREDQGLPDYLRDDANPQVPVDVMPIIPMEGGGGGT